MAGHRRGYAPRGLPRVKVEGAESDPGFAPDIVDRLFVSVTRRGFRYEGRIGLAQYSAYQTFPMRNIDGTSTLRTVGFRERELLAIPLEYGPGQRPTTSGVLLALARELTRVAEALAGNPSPDALEGQAELF